MEQNINHAASAPVTLPAPRFAVILLLSIALLLSLSFYDANKLVTALDTVGNAYTEGHAFP